MQTLASSLMIGWVLSWFGFNEAFYQTRCAPVKGVDSIVLSFASESNDRRNVTFMGDSRAFAFLSSHSKGILDWRYTRVVRLTSHDKNQTLMTIEYQQESDSSLRIFEVGYLTDACSDLLTSRYGSRLNFVRSDRTVE